MNHWIFLFRINRQRVTQAITQAELRSSGEIRVYVTHRKCSDALSAAQEQFKKLGMSQTKLRNGVLIFIAPRSRTFAIIGDQAVHEKCGEPFWREVSDAMSVELKSGRMTEALVHAVDRAGALLALHFPPSSAPENEMPDAITSD